MKRIIITIALVLSAFVPSFAQEAAVSDFALAFTRFPRDAAGASLAGASTAYRGSLEYAAFSSAAKLPAADFKMAAGAGYGSLFPKLSKETSYLAGVSFKAGGRLAFSLGFVSSKGEAYDQFDANGNKKAPFTPGDMIMRAGAGFAFSDALSAGFTASFASSSLAADYKVSKVSFDALAQYVAGSFTATGGIKNIGPSVKSESGKSFSQPSSALVAAGWNGFFDPVRLDVLAEANYYFNGALSVSAGLEVKAFDIASLRGGYHFATSTCPVPSFASVGAGVDLYGISVNVSCLLGSDALGGSFLAGIGYCF